MRRYPGRRAAVQYVGAGFLALAAWLGPAAAAEATAAAAEATAAVAGGTAAAAGGTPMAAGGKAAAATGVAPPEPATPEAPDSGVGCAAAPATLSPGTRILRCLPRTGGADARRQAREELGRRLGLDSEAAARLASALARQEALRSRRAAAIRERSTEAFKAAEADELPAIESAFIDALDAAPENAAAAEEVRQFYREWRSPASGTAPAPGMLALIARSSDPARLALRLAGRPGIGYHGESVALLLAALAVRPGAAVLWAYAAQAAFGSLNWQIAFLEQSFRCLVPPGSTPDRDTVPAAAAIAESWLSKELEAGLAPRAAAAWYALPPAVRAVVEAGEERRFETTLDGVPFSAELRDFRLELAAAAVLAGNPQEARRLLTNLPPAAPEAVAAGSDSLAHAGRGRGLERRLLERWLAAPRDDPFNLLVEAVRSRQRGASEADSLDAACWQLVLARAAEREGYPGIAAYVLAFLAINLPVLAGDDEIAGTGRGVPPAVLIGGRAAAAEMVRLARELDEEAQAARARMRAALGPDPAAPIIARLLAAPLRGAAFEERPLPANLAPAGTLAKATAALRLPAGFTAVRTERQGKRMAVIALSRQYDDRWQVSNGGYWVLLSDEAGERWRRPLYTGLRENLPYTVRETSALPLLAGDRLQVEVEVKELNPFFATDAGPAELAPRQPRRGFYLDMPLSALERDSDGDGLTDLEEQRLLTDPEAADTDHDGLADGVDPMPTVAAVDTPSPEAGPVAALLTYMLEKGVQRPAAPERQPSAPRRRAPLRGCCDAEDDPSAPPWRATVFVAGERQWFAGLHPVERLIVLTPEEVAALRRKVTAPLIFGIDLLVLDRSGRRAVAIWRGELRGGTVELEQRGDGWHLRPLDFWES
jgi:hypothetical protein